MSTLSFTKLAQTLEIQSKILREFEALAALDGKSARLLVAQLAEMAGVSAPTASDTSARLAAAPSGVLKQAHERIEAALAASDNRPMTKEQVIERAGVTASQVHAIFYDKPYRDSFVSARNPAGGKAKVFQLTAEAFDRVRSPST